MDENASNTGWKQIFRTMVPDVLLRERQLFLRLGPKAGPIYARLRLLDTVGVHSPNIGKVPSNAQSFLFVCFGNIMRSPMAEAMFRKAASQASLATLRVCSAGVHAINGSQAHPMAMEASQELGLPLSQHRAQLLTPDLVSEADVILVMDFQNKAEVLALYPEARQKVLMLSAYAGNAHRYREIPDPYFGDLETTRRCYAVLETCIQNLTAELAAHSAHAAAPVSR